MNMLHNTYLPFEENELKKHFRNEDHLKPILESLKNYSDRNTGALGAKKARQIEKDETIWTASCFTSLFMDDERDEHLIKLLTGAYGNKPPLKNFDTWEKCLEGGFEIYFEVQIPSSDLYMEYLKNNVVDKLTVQYVKEAGKRNIELRKRLEGPSHIDAVIINPNNGFSVFVEAKVLSDISYQVTFDENRNQIIRNLDVMLEKNDRMESPFNKRNPENTLFLLLTPRKFREREPKSRLYAYKYQEYKANPDSLKMEMPYRRELDEKYLSARIGWITWEDFRDISQDYCGWLKLLG